jgi:hypothetical protein
MRNPKQEPLYQRRLHASRMVSIVNYMRGDEPSETELVHGCDAMQEAYRDTMPELPALAQMGIERVEVLKSNLTVEAFDKEFTALQKHMQNWAKFQS